MALFSSSKPIFFNSPSSPSSLPSYPDLTLLLELRNLGSAAAGSQYNDLAIFLDDVEIDGEPARALGVMLDFCSVIHFAPRFETAHLRRNLPGYHGFGHVPPPRHALRGPL